jgi:hypothetical protein
MKFAIADPPYLGRAVRYYGEGGRGGRNRKQADKHPEAFIWDNPKTHQDLAKNLMRDFDGFAIAMSVHSLSTYLQVLETDSENGIRVGVWHRPNAVPSGSRVTNYWEPVIFKIPKCRKGRFKGPHTNDVLTCNISQNGFIGSKPIEWTHWVLDVLGVTEDDEVHDLFHGSGAVADALKIQRLPL